MIMVMLMLIILLVSKIKLYVPIVTFSAKTIKSYQNFVARDLKDKCVGVNIRQKERIKMQQMSIDVFLNQAL